MRQVNSAFHYFYPRPPRGGRHPELGVIAPGIISTHALREEGDGAALWSFPCSGFLPTPSARRATGNRDLAGQVGRDFYPRPPRGGRCTCGPSRMPFYPRPPRGGRCGYDGRYGANAGYFYPRPPRGGRHLHRALDKGGHHFYPRPPRGGRHEIADLRPEPGHPFYPRPPRGGRPASLRWRGTWSRMYFYPRPPRGGRRPGRAQPATSSFLPTPSARRATFHIATIRIERFLFLPTPSARRAFWVSW